MLVDFLSCRERFRLKYVLGLETHDKWKKTYGYGNMWHVCEEALAATKYIDDATDPQAAMAEVVSLPEWAKALTRYTDQLLIKYPMQLDRDEIGRWYHVCCVQFPEYVRYWAGHPDVRNRTPLMQEKVFDVPYNLPSGRTVRLRGKFDSVDLIEDVCGLCQGDVTERPLLCHICNGTGKSGGGIYLQENKTKGDIDKLQVERQLKFDLQTMIYLIALESWINDRCQDDPGLAELFSAPILGVRYNVVRRPLSGGVGSIRPHVAKSTKTKFTPAETDEEFYERLRRDYIAADPAHWFFRVRSEVSARDVQVFRDTCLDPLLETVCRWYDEVTNQPRHVYITDSPLKPYMNYRTPFGVYSALEEGGATEYDSYLETGSEAGLRRVETLFTELQ